MQKIVVFGGTFNPIHLGHVRLYRHFADSLNADKALIIPAKIPPHKRPSELADGASRLAMCALAVQDDPRAEVSDVELRREGPSYTADTLEELSGRYPGARLYFVVGSDMLLTLDAWRDPQRILKLAAICALARRPGEFRRLLQKSAELKERFGGEYLIDDARVMDISSTQARRAVKEGGDLSALLPDAVAEYIKENGLYQAYEL